MFNWLLNFLSKDLTQTLNETRNVRVNGIRFKIKKIDPLNFLDGSNVMLQTFDTYKAGKEQNREISEKKIRDHVAQVLVAGVAEPKLSHKEGIHTSCEGDTDGKYWWKYCWSPRLL